MSSVTTVRPDKAVVSALKGMLLHKIQQPKMMELWGNKEDEAWEDA